MHKKIYKKEKKQQLEKKKSFKDFIKNIVHFASNIPTNNPNTICFITIGNNVDIPLLSISNNIDNVAI